MYILIFARNILNIKDIENYIDKIIKVRHPNDAIETWLKKRVKEYLQNDYEGVLSVTPDDLKQTSWIKKSIPDISKGVPKWVTEGIENKTLLKIVLPSGYDIYEDELTDKIYNIIDYFESLCEKELDKIYKIPFDMAYNKYNMWKHEQLKSVPAELNEIGEFEVKNYNDGMRWVRLLSPEALHKEGNVQDICLKDGRYDKDVLDGESLIYSLRDSENNPHCTIEILRNNSVEQIKGYGDGKIESKYIPYVIQFLEFPVLKREYKYTVNGNDDLYNIKCHIIDGKLINLYNLPENYTFKDNLEYSDDNYIRTLPKNLTVKGNLDLFQSSIVELSEGLTVYGFLDLSNTRIKSLPSKLKVGKDLICSESALEELSQDIVVKGEINLSYCRNFRELSLIPNLTDIDLTKSGIQTLPDNLTVNGFLLLNSALNLKKLPKNLTVGGTLDIRKSNVSILSRNISVGVDFLLDYSRVIELPKNLKVGGILSLYNTKVTELPIDLEAEIVHSDVEFSVIPKGVGKVVTK